MTEPLSPAGCDLSGYTYFPLHHERLLKSKWWRRASHMARSVNVDLWAYSFREVPAGSLPDDDLELTDMAGFGRDVDAFLKVKKEIMAPWVLCSDGRWYHPTVSEVAIELWEKIGAGRRAARLRQQASRARIAAAKAVTPKEQHVTRDTPPSSRVTDLFADPPVTRDIGPVTPNMPSKGEERKLGATAPVAPAAPDATEKAVSEPWRVDPNFALAWAACTKQMRRRSKSRELTWPHWKRTAARVGSDNLLIAHRRYLREDDDIQRTGGPGFIRWLADGRWEEWVSAAPGAEWTEDHWKFAVRQWREGADWGETLGPAPGQPGCRVPAHLLLTDAEEAKARA